MALVSETFERCREVHRPKKLWRDFGTHQFCIVCLILIYEDVNGQLSLRPRDVVADVSGPTNSVKKKLDQPLL